MVTQQEKEKIKQILTKTKIDIAVEIDKVHLPLEVYANEQLIWKEIKKEEAKIKDLPIFQSIKKKQMDADMGMYIKPIKYTSEEEKFLKTHSSNVKQLQLITELDTLNTKEKKLLKTRLLTNKASEFEIKQLENAEMKIWNNGKELLGEKGNDLPAFSVDSDYYDIFNHEGDWGRYSSYGDQVTCNLQQQLNAIGFDYESQSAVDKIIFKLDKPISKTQFLKQNQSCKKYIKSK